MLRVLTGDVTALLIVIFNFVFTEENDVKMVKEVKRPFKVYSEH